MNRIKSILSSITLGLVLSVAFIGCKPPAEPTPPVDPTPTPNSTSADAPTESSNTTN